MNQILELAIPNVRRIIGVMDNIEEALANSIIRLSAESVGNIKLRSALPGQSEQDALEREYQRWGGRLADTLGVPFYPFSRRYRPGTGRAGVTKSIRFRS